MTRIHIPIHLRWGDLDALGHVNNVAMARLLEEARIRAFFSSTDLPDQAPPSAIFTPDTLESGEGVMTVVARQTIEFRAPVLYGHRPLDVQLWVGHLGGSSMTVRYEVHPHPDDTGGDRVYVVAETVVVLVDAQTGRPVRMSEEMRAAWQGLLEDSEPESSTR